MAETVDATPSDAELVAGCRKGDPEAWNALVERFSRYVSAIATQAFRLPPHDAEDVFQDGLHARLRAARLAPLRRRDPAVDRPADAELLPRPAALVAAAIVPTEEIEEQAADDVIARLDEAMTVRDGLSRLGPECQEILDRFFARDESYRTIGDALDIPAGTIASRISRCLGRLRAEVER